MGRKNELVVSCPSEYQAVVPQSRGLLRELSVTVIVDTPQRQLGLFINKTPKVKAVFCLLGAYCVAGIKRNCFFQNIDKAVAQ